MRGFPIELRERIVAAHVDQGLSISEVAELFAVSYASVRRYVKKASRGESLEPSSPPGAAEKLGRKEREWLRRALEANPFTTSYELAARYNRSFPSNQVHRSSILRAMHRLGFTHKKRRQ